MKITLALLILTLTTPLVNAQVFTRDQTDKMDDVLLRKINSIKSEELIFESKNIDGSPYFKDNFQQGKIVFKGKTYIFNMRYRIFDDKFEVKKNENDIFFLQRNSDFEIYMGQNQFNFIEKLPITINQASNGYGLLLSKKETYSTSLLYKHLAQTYSPKKPARSSYDTDRKARIETDVYYFLKTGNRVLQIEPSRRGAADAFPDKNDELEDFIKDERLRFRGDDEETDLIKLVEYYNSL